MDLIEESAEYEDYQFFDEIEESWLFFILLLAFSPIYYISKLLK